MTKAQAARVQRLTRKSAGRGPRRLRQRSSLPLSRHAVYRIADQRMTLHGQVNANLMRPPREQPAFDKAGRGTEPLDYPVASDRHAAAAGDDGHLLSIGRAAADVSGNFRGGRNRHAPDDRPVDTVDVMRGELGDQPLVSRLGLGSHQHAAGVLVQSMNDARTAGVADPRQPVAAMGEKGVYQRPIRIARGGMDHEASRFIDNDQMVILEQNVQWHGLGHEVEFFDRRHRQHPALARPSLRRRVERRPGFAFQLPGLDQAAQAGPRQGGQGIGQEPVEALAGLCRPDGQMMLDRVVGVGRR